MTEKINFHPAPFVMARRAAETTKDPRYEYKRQRWKNNPEAYRRGRLANKARELAQKRLTHLYPTVFTRLLNEERAKMGLEPLYRRGDV